MEKRHFTKNQKKLIGGVAIVIFVVFSAAICWFVGKPMVKFVSEPEKFPFSRAAPSKGGNGSP